MRFVALVVIASLAACERATPRVEPITPAEARRVTEAVIAAVHPTCDTAKVGALLDFKAFADRFAIRAGNNPFATSVATASLFLGGHVEKTLCVWLAHDATLKILRTDAGEPIVRKLVRNPLTQVISVAYIKLQLVRSEQDHEIRIADAYSYYQGLWLTEGIGEVLATQVSTPRTALRDARELHRVRDLEVAGRYDEALAVIDALPPALRATRQIQMIRVALAQRISHAAYLAALDELAHNFPDDPTTALAEIDGAVLHADFDAAIRDVDTVDKEVGGDPFQAAIRAKMYQLRGQPGDVEHARQIVDQAIKDEPTLGKPWYVKLDVELARKDWPAALAVMDHLSAKFATKFTDAALAKPAFAELVASDAFAQWRRSHPPPN